MSTNRELASIDVYSPCGLGLPELSDVEVSTLDAEQYSVDTCEALEHLLRIVPAAGTALIQPCTDGTALWQIEYVGQRSDEMQRWLTTWRNISLKDTAQALQETPPYLPHTTPLVWQLDTRASSVNGLWILWTYSDLAYLTPHDEELDKLRRDLEILVEVEHKEQLYFRGSEALLDSELRSTVANKDSNGLPALLSIARTISSADLTYWGNVVDNVVQVDWHSGAKRSEFSFELPLKQGVGGRAFHMQKIFHVPDYQNCEYRYPGVSDECDKQEIRTKLAIPLQNSSRNTDAVLYATRRAVAPFSISEYLILYRLARHIESASDSDSSSRYFFPSEEASVIGERAELRQILLESHQVHDLESWIEKFINGPAMLLNSEGYPYSLSNLNRLESLQWSSSSKKGSQTISLEQPGGDRRGDLYIWPSIPIPPAGWPDFLDDTIATCNIVLDRTEQANTRLNYQRSCWLECVLQETTPQARREGYRLGLPVDHGEIWAVAWGRESSQGAEPSASKLLIEDIALDQLRSPPIFLDDDIIVFLFGEQPHIEPSTLRDKLLRVFGPNPLWLTHGAIYESFDALKQSILQATTIASKARYEDNQTYVLEVNSVGLHGLLTNPNLSDGLDAFAKKLLKPLLTHDGKTGSELTETLALVLALGSVREAAKRLYIHRNTARHRIHRAEQILGRDLDSPADRTALHLATYVWLHSRTNFW